MITVKRKAMFTNAKKRRANVEAPVGSVPRVARLMALAIRFDQLIREGMVVDQAELARLGKVSRARLTQIMTLLSLSPDIQESLLFMPYSLKGRQLITERTIRPISGLVSWKKQRCHLEHRHQLAKQE